MDWRIDRAEMHRANEGLNPMYYKVMTCILLFPWSILAVMIAGHLRTLWEPKA